MLSNKDRIMYLMYERFIIILYKITNIHIYTEQTNIIYN